MASRNLSVTGAAVLVAVAVSLSACGGGARHSAATTSAMVRPQRILRAPGNLLAAAAPQQNDTMWVLAGSTRSRGLFQLDPSNGHMLGSISVSKAAQSVAQSSTGLLGLALGTNRTGALQILDSHTGKAIRTVSLPAPAREVVVGSDGTTFYVLTGWPSSASVSVVNSRSGRIGGAVPVPRGTVSVVPDVQQSTLYALQGNGLLSQIAIAGGKVKATFRVGDSGASLALSPDGTTLYALKDTDSAANIASVDVATESVRRALPAPSNAREILVSATGSQLYDVVGTAAYGNIQVFGA